MNEQFSLLALQDGSYLITVFWFVERVGAEVVECACVIELPELKVSSYICCISILRIFFMLKSDLAMVVSKL